MLNKGDKVWFYYIDQNDKVQFHEGTVEIIDKDGTWECPGTPSYDIYAITDKYPEGCLFKHQSENTVATSLEELINIFRERRNEFYDKSKIYQNAIDKTIMMNEKVHIKPGDYINYHNNYIKIDSVNRLFYGIRILGSLIIIDDVICNYYSSDSIDVNWSDVKDIQIISKEEFLNKCKEGYETFINSLESTVD